MKDWEDGIRRLQEEITKVTTGKAAPPREQGVKWRAKLINGKRYVPLDQVVELLRVNDVLPAVRRGLEKSL